MTNKNLSRDVKGSKNPMWGKKNPHTIESRVKISASLKGRKAWNRDDSIKRYKYCGYCSNKFIKHPKISIKSWKNKKFCSQSCYMKDKNLAGKNNPMYGKPAWNRGVHKYTSICKTCNKEFFYYPGKSIGKYCSQKCFSINNRGSNNCNFVGSGKYYRGLDWKEVRTKVRMRDKYMCFKCGMSNEECLLDFNCQLHVHHIIPYRLCKSNNIDNLVSLCPKCHKEEEQKILLEELGGVSDGGNK